MAKPWDVSAYSQLERKLLSGHLLEFLDKLAIAEVQPLFLCHNGKIMDMSRHHGIQIVKCVGCFR